MIKLFNNYTDLNNLWIDNRARLLWGAGFFSFLFCIFWTVYTGEWWWLLAVVITQKIVSPVANGIALHRYFSHRSFRTGPLRHKFLVWVSVLGAAGSPIGYATHHRHHHKNSDKSTDVHSPHVSMIDALGFFAFRSPRWYQDVKSLQIQDLPRDLFKMDHVAFVHRNYYVIWTMILIISAAISWKVLFLYTLPLVGYYLLGAGFFINMMSHWKIPGSYRNFDTDDKSQNNQWIHNWTMQEGLHNNHHKHPSTYDQAMRPGEFDLSGWIVKKFFDVDSKKNSHV